MQDFQQFSDQSKFRNFAIIAHVDHGKTTLVDTLIRYSGLSGQQSMDSIDLEQEKGITIQSKCTSILYKNYKINIVDTPGHADFGGEVERIMSMVDGVLLLVCATEGPMAQTKFVVQKAFKQKLKPIVIINKVERPSARMEEVQTEVFDLFCDLHMEDDFLDYPVFFASGREGWATKTIEEAKEKLKNQAISEEEKQLDVSCILDGIIEHFKAPNFDINADFKMLVTQTSSNQYFGKLCIGRILQGTVLRNDKLTSVDMDGQLTENSKVIKILKKIGQSTIELEQAIAGDIIQLAGFSNSGVGSTLNVEGKTEVIPSIPIDPPIISFSIDINNSPLNGKEGTKFSKSQIFNRLVQEGENDVALQVLANKDSEGIIVKGRGDLHLGLLVEKMRREGFELSVSPPMVITRQDEQGRILEPIEKITIEVEDKYVQNIVEIMGNRGATYIDFEDVSDDIKQVHFSCPTRGTIGIRSQILNETKGKGMITQELIGYEPHKGKIQKNLRGAIISMAEGVCTEYGIKQNEKFGQLFVRPSQKVYIGMVIGEHLKESDVEVNPTRSKQLTNIRTHSHDENIVLLPYRKFSVEEAVSYIREDELVEVTPKEIRIRKKELDTNIRKRTKRIEANQSKK